MWNEQKRQRFKTLREQGRTLSSVERAELDTLTKELVDEESARLGPVTEKLRQENDERARRQRELTDLIKRKEALVSRLEKTLAEAKAEERAIEGRLAVLTADISDNCD